MSGGWRLVLVCGGRGYADEVHVFRVLDEHHRRQRFDGLVHGGAAGADALAGQWARANGVQEIVCPANWDYYGRSAGPRRNGRMLLLRPALVIAFPGGAGTRDMVARAGQAGVATVCVPPRH